MVEPIKKKTTKKKVAKKSGLRRLKPGEVLFNEKEAADSLFIIQEGQIRLYLHKGKGYVEIGILRAGEVIGEMGYFDEKNPRRSCSASSRDSIGLKSALTV